MCGESKFSDYLAHESDFISIFMQMLSSQLENLPVPISQTELSLPGPQSIGDVLSSNYGPRIEAQYESFVDICNFLREIVTILYNEQRLTTPWDQYEPMS